MASVPARTTAAAGAGPAALDGRSRASLERQLFETVTAGAAAVPGGRREARDLVLALIHLRRTHADVYDHERHLRFRRREGRCFAAEPARRGLESGHPPGSAVHVTGEPHNGTVIHAEPGWDPGDAYPAVWYVVAVPSLGICRAHGADELEPALLPGRGGVRRTRERAVARWP
ncbi:hypothetical protein [Streptomyces sp. SHP 1-2]|uniref:hypothetical protein n=1 Tax=Streptomyces sp. SHP 1-2 TaxID=2769489 RepID=UPI0022388B32|nr:hypothetical protein [Streptomyces sp. SHP 1-2]MCW5251459.1 hypothetical protein [Streptomyces sp. SHP 1-2]